MLTISGFLGALAAHGNSVHGLCLRGRAAGLKAVVDYLADMHRDDRVASQLGLRPTLLKPRVAVANAVDLSTRTEVSTEVQAMANAAMINEYILAQVDRLNHESDITQLA